MSQDTDKAAEKIIGWVTPTGKLVKASWQEIVAEVGVLTQNIADLEYQLRHIGNLTQVVEVPRSCWDKLQIRNDPFNSGEQR